VPVSQSRVSANQHTKRHNANHLFFTQGGSFFQFFLNCALDYTQFCLGLLTLHDMFSVCRIMLKERNEPISDPSDTLMGAATGSA
jgi:hypothetical protein